MKRFTVTTITVVATHFSGREYRGYFSVDLTDDEIAARLEDDDESLGFFHDFSGLGTTTTTTETSAYSRTIPEVDE